MLVGVSVELLASPMACAVGHIYMANYHNLSCGLVVTKYHPHEFNHKRKLQTIASIEDLQISNCNMWFQARHFCYAYCNVWFITNHSLIAITLQYLLSWITVNLAGLGWVPFQVIKVQHVRQVNGRLFQSLFLFFFYKKQCDFIIDKSSAFLQQNICSLWQI